MRRSMPVMFSVTFVRHGETAMNREHRIQGHLDVPLSSLGEKQATLAGTKLCNQKYTRVYASDLQRAYQTCERILGENTCFPPPIKVDKRLRERNFGSVEGMHIDEVKTMASAKGLVWPLYNPPGAETLGALQERMVCFFKELCQSVYDKSNASKCDEVENCEADDNESSGHLQAKKERDVIEKILVVSHGAALKQLYIHLHKTLGCPLSGDQDILNKIAPNTGISEYTVQFAPKKYILQCIRIHDQEHLLTLS